MKPNLYLWFVARLGTTCEKHQGVLLLVKLQALVYNFTKRNTLPWVFFTFFKLQK